MVYPNQNLLNLKYWYEPTDWVHGGEADAFWRCNTCSLTKGKTQFCGVNMKKILLLTIVLILSSCRCHKEIESKSASYSY